MPDNVKTLNSVIDALENNSFSKLICGASNTNQKQIERLALVYSLAGINAIDIAPDEEIFRSAQNSVIKAGEIFRNNPLSFPHFNEPLLMISLNAGNDIHFRKIEFNQANCINCFDCINICPAEAFYKDLSKGKNILKFNKNNCFGCRKCLGFCNALSMDENLKNQDTLTGINNHVEAVEIHTGKCSVNEVENFLRKIPRIVNNVKILSFSINSGLFNRSALIDYASFLSVLTDKKPIIQIDGESMSATSTNSSSLQAMAAAEYPVNSKINAYIQISGGINHLTSKYLNLFNLRVSGIGYGTFARKILLPYIEGFNDDEFFDNLPKCVNIATNLVKATTIQLKNSV